jgi:hypothetical protein
MKTALIAISCLPNPDNQIWQILATAKTRPEAETSGDEIDQMIEKGED